MPDNYENRVKQAVTAVASSGLGTLTLGAAAAGSLALGAGHNGQTFGILIKEGDNFEVCNGCAYTHSGTTLTRGTLESSSAAGSRVAFTTAATVEVTLTAAQIAALGGGGGLPTGVTSPGDGALDFATGSITTSRPSVKVAQTWNASGQAFYGVDVQITDTASSAASMPLRVRGGAAGTTNLLSVAKDGLITTAGNRIAGSANWLDILSATATMSVSTTLFSDRIGITSYGVNFRQGILSAGDSGLDGGLFDFRHAANPCAVRVYEITNLTNASGGSAPTNYSRINTKAVAGDAFQIVTEAAGTGTRRNLTLSAPQVAVDGLFMPYQRTNATEPSWVNGAVFFNTDLDKLRIGGASAWETVTSV